MSRNAQLDLRLDGFAVVTHAFDGQRGVIFRPF